MSIALKLIELIAVAVWFGGALTKGAIAWRGAGCALALAAVTMGRTAMWGYNPVYGPLLLLVAAGAGAGFRWPRPAALAAGGLYLFWMAMRGY